MPINIAAIIAGLTSETPEQKAARAVAEAAQRAEAARRMADWQAEFQRAHGCTYEEHQARQEVARAEAAAERARRHAARAEAARAFNAALGIPVEFDVAQRLVRSGLSARSSGDGASAASVWHARLLGPLASGRLRREAGDLLCGADEGEVGLSSGAHGQDHAVSCRGCLAAAERIRARAAGATRAPTLAEAADAAARVVGDRLAALLPGGPLVAAAALDGGLSSSRGFWLGDDPLEDEVGVRVRVTAARAGGFSALVYVLAPRAAHAEAEAASPEDLASRLAGDPALHALCRLAAEQAGVRAPAL